LTCTGPFPGPFLVPIHVSFLPLFVSVYNLRSVLVVLMLVDDNLLLLLLLILVLLMFLLLLSELGCCSFVERMVSKT